MERLSDQHRKGPVTWLLILVVQILGIILRRMLLKNIPQVIDGLIPRWPRKRSVIDPVPQTKLSRDLTIFRRNPHSTMFPKSQSD